MLVHSLKKHCQGWFWFPACACVKDLVLCLTVLGFSLPLLRQSVELGFWAPMEPWLNLSSSESDTDAFRDCSKCLVCLWKFITIYHSKWVMAEDAFSDTKSWWPDPGNLSSFCEASVTQGSSPPPLTMNNLGLHLWCCWSLRMLAVQAASAHDSASDFFQMCDSWAMVMFNLLLWLC